MEISSDRIQYTIFCYTLSKKEHIMFTLSFFFFAFISFFFFFSFVDFMQIKMQRVRLKSTSFRVNWIFAGENFTCWFLFFYREPTVCSQHACTLSWKKKIFFLRGIPSEKFQCAGETYCLVENFSFFSLLLQF